MTVTPKHASKEISAAIGFNGKCLVTYNGFIEKDTKHWKPIFEWNAYGHIGLEESVVDQESPEERCTVDRWDYL